jgi:hypothetical protein
VCVLGRRSKERWLEQTPAAKSEQTAATTSDVDDGSAVRVYQAQTGTSIRLTFGTTAVSRAMCGPGATLGAWMGRGGTQAPYRFCHSTQPCLPAALLGHGTFDFTCSKAPRAAQLATGEPEKCCSLRASHGRFAPAALFGLACVPFVSRTGPAPITQFRCMSVGGDKQYCKMQETALAARNLFCCR